MNITVTQYRDAISNALSDSQVELLRTLYNFPNSTASAKELAAAMGYKSFHAANRQVGQIGKIIAEYLNITPPTYYDRGEEQPAYFLLIGPYDPRDGKVRSTSTGWEMVENMRKALERLSSSSQQKAYLLLWNPKRWSWDTLEDDIQQVERTGTTKERWSCGNTKSIQAGDRVFLIKLGTAPKGIIASGFAATSPYTDKYWADENRNTLYIDVDFEVLLNPDKEPILTLDILQSGNLSKQRSWTPQMSGTSIRPEIIEELEAVWFEFLRTHEVRHNLFLPSENTAQKTFTEGAANQVLQTRYERNPYARKVCIGHYGYSCSVCGFNFEQHFGPLGKGFIHVHHQTQISAAGKANQIDPIKALRPVCPNCHAMLHRQNPPLTIEALKHLRNEN